MKKYHHGPEFHVSFGIKKKIGQFLATCLFLFYLYKKKNDSFSFIYPKNYWVRRVNRWDEEDENDWLKWLKRWEIGDAKIRWWGEVAQREKVEWEGNPNYFYGRGKMKISLKKKKKSGRWKCIFAGLDFMFHLG